MDEFIGSAIPLPATHFIRFFRNLLDGMELYHVFRLQRDPAIEK